MNKLSVVLATYNEEMNLGRCLESVKNLATEIVVVDGSSNDATVDIAKKFGAKVVVTENHKIFHINKQKAIKLATYPWVLLMDADEVVTESLAKEISAVTNMTEGELVDYQHNLKNKKMFARHQSLLEERDGKIGDNSLPYAGFFIPRLNYFLGGYLRYGGVYPDGVIRLVKNGKAYLPAKDVHEQIVVEGKVGWLKSDLLHIDSPTFERYLQRNSRYIDLLADEIRTASNNKGFLQMVNFMIIKPLFWFLNTLIRHKGILDGWRGVAFSFFSAMRFPRAYMRYLRNV